jgi:hypothetical protein
MTTNPEPSFAIIELQPFEPPPPSHIAWGSGSLIRDFFDSQHARIRADAALARADSTMAHAQAQSRRAASASIAAFDAALRALTHRIDALEATHRAREKADAEAEARRLQAQIDELPDPDDHNPGTALYPPAGDLTAIHPADEMPSEHAGGNAVHDPTGHPLRTIDPSTGHYRPTDDDPAHYEPAGDLHAFHPAKHEVAAHASLPGDPSPPARMGSHPDGNYPFKSIDKPRMQFAQPTAAGLDEDDDY